jgi:hypothetical protein
MKRSLVLGAATLEVTFASKTDAATAVGSGRLP